MPHPISAVILTKNEAVCIERCIRGVRTWADEVLVLDSESTDATREIAASLGARVVVQPWLGWVLQRQRAVALAEHDWVFCIDTDEVPDDRLSASILKALDGDPDPRDGFNVVRRDEFFGQLMPNFRNPARQRASIRMFNRLHSNYGADQLIHEEAVVPGRSIALDGVLVHWRNFTLADQMSRYIGNSALEVRQAEAANKRSGPFRIMAMPLLRFLWVYVARGSWRCGMAGLVTAMMIACAEFLRWASLWERQNVRRLPHPPEALISRPSASLAGPARREASTSP